MGCRYVRETTQESLPKARMSGMKCGLLLVMFYLWPQEIAVQVLSALIAKEILTTRTEHKKEINQGWWPLEKCMLRHLEVALATARLCVHKIQITLLEYHSALHSWIVEFSVTPPHCCGSRPNLEKSAYSLSAYLLDLSATCRLVLLHWEKELLPSDFKGGEWGDWRQDPGRVTRHME